MVREKKRPVSEITKDLEETDVERKMKQLQKEMYAAMEATKKAKGNSADAVGEVIRIQAEMEEVMGEEDIRIAKLRRQKRMEAGRLTEEDKWRIEVEKLEKELGLASVILANDLEDEDEDEDEDELYDGEESSETVIKKGNRHALDKLREGITIAYIRPEAKSTWVGVHKAVALEASRLALALEGLAEGLPDDGAITINDDKLDLELANLHRTVHKLLAECRAAVEAKKHALEHFLSVCHALDACPEWYTMCSSPADPTALGIVNALTEMSKLIDFEDHPHKPTGLAAKNYFDQFVTEFEQHRLMGDGDECEDGCSHDHHGEDDDDDDDDDEDDDDEDDDDEKGGDDDDDDDDEEGDDDEEED